MGPVDKVTETQVVDVATEIGTDWPQFAALILPRMFSTKVIKEIKQDNGSTFEQARAMLEKWTNALDRDATCCKVIIALLRMELKRQAVSVFSRELVEHVEQKYLQ